MLKNNIHIETINPCEPLWQQTLQKLRHDIYHLPEYIQLESIRNKAAPEGILITEGDKIFFLPYLVRSCEHLTALHLRDRQIFDAVSPYGYPGILLSESAISEPEFLKLAVSHFIEALRSKNICTAFLRLHPILNQNFEQILSPQICQVTGETISLDLALSEAEIWQQTRSEHRNHINRCKRAGFIARMVKYEDYIDEFIYLYKDTMNRVAAKQMYYFDYEYFVQLAYLDERIHICIVELGDRITCAGIFTEASGIVQYHLGGTRNEFLKQSPSKLMFDYVRFWAKARGNLVFHLGGGVGGSKDSLYHFKAGFSKQRTNFLTLRLIADLDNYNYLVELQAKALNTETNRLLDTNFFPAYRCSSVENN